MELQGDSAIQDSATGFVVVAVVVTVDTERCDCGVGLQKIQEVRPLALSLLPPLTPLLRLLATLGDVLASWSCVGAEV